MAISDKLTYLNETKSQLKDMINYGLDDENKITSSTTFRNYVSSIFNAFLEALRTPDTLFTNLPKKSGTGAVISLNDTANAPMRIELSASEISQAGTPTPDSPQDIHTISGSNKVVVNGSNLFDEEYYNNADLYTTASYRYTLTNIVGNRNLYSFAQLKEGKTSISGLYLALCTKENPNIAGNVTKWLVNNGSVITATSIGFNDKNIYITWYPSSITPAQIFDTYNIMVSTTDTSYEPYISQEADIDLGYENLFNKDSANILNSYINASGVISASTTDRMIWLPIKENTDYTFQITQYSLASVQQEDDIQVGLFNTQPANNVSGTRIFRETRGSSVSNKSFTYTFNSGSNTYVGIKIGTLNKSDYNQTIGTLQLNEGTTALPYTEYGKKIEYCKIGTYEDKFIRTSGKNLFETEYILTTANTTNISAHLKKETYTLSLANKPNFGGVIYIQLYKNGTLITTDGHLLNTSSAVSFSTSSYWYYFSNIPNGNYLTFTLDGDYDVKIALANATGTQKAMLNKGTTALDYEPYGSNEWYIKKNIGKVVLDGNITLNYNGTAGQFYNTNQNNIPNYQARTPMLCNYLQYSSTTWVKNCFGITSTNVFWLYIENGPTTLADLQTWLSTHNLDIRYVLATPTYTQITGTLAEQLENIYQKLLSYTGTTNISQVNNDLSFVLDVEAVESVGE